MHIYIPTRGRAGNQITFRSLSPELRRNTTFVVDHGYASAMKLKGFGEQGAEIWELPEGVKGIAYVRQQIMDHSPHRFIVMLDDDLKLYVKNSGRKIIDATVADVNTMFAQLEQWLAEGFAHASITPRFLNWQHPGPYIDVTRMMHVLAYDREKVAAAGCSFTTGIDPGFSMDDFNMTLQLLRKGLPNRVDVDHCTSPSASNSAGGASEWRTLASHNASATRLEELHRPFVRVSKKQGWQGMPGDRYDVTVQWRKAFESSKVV